MSPKTTDRPFLPVNIAVLTVSDSRTESDDKSGKTLAELLTAAGHKLAAKRIVKDDQGAIIAQLKAWIADPSIDVVISTGGTGVTGRDVTPEAFHAVYEKEIAGFGELFRMLSYQKIGTSTIQSRASAGVAGRHLSLRAAGFARRLPRRLGDHRAPARQPPTALQPGRADAAAEGAFGAGGPRQALGRSPGKLASFRNFNISGARLDHRGFATRFSAWAMQTSCIQPGRSTLNGQTV